MVKCNKTFANVAIPFFRISEMNVKVVFWVIIIDLEFVNISTLIFHISIPPKRLTLD